MEFDESIYNEQFKLTLTDGDAATENEKKVGYAIHIISWCILCSYYKSKIIMLENS